MQFVRRFGGQVTRTALVATALFAAACSSDDTGAGPVIPGTPTPNPTITRAAFLADVNVRTGEVKFRAPVLTGTQTGLLKDGEVDPSLQGVDLSLVGGDVVQLTSSNFVASTVGAFDPGKIRVTFDVSITNKLSGVQLVGPTVFPAPPAGTTGPILFPFDVAVAVTSGGTATGGQGNDIIVTLPSYGLVAPSDNWDGAPHNFFNDTGCSTTNNGGGTGNQGGNGGFGTNNGSDCFRWEEFLGPIFPGSTTGAQQVGFDLDPTVGQFTARILVAADLQNSGPAPTGTVAGTVTSPQLGALTGVTVQATSGITSLTDVSVAGGAYSIAAVPTGPASVAILSGLPAGCTNPGSQSATVTNGGTATVNFTVTCPVPVGSINGQINFTGFTPSSAEIDAIIAAATPTGGSAVSGNVSTTGAISIANVPVGPGTGAVALSNLPSNCTNPGAGSYAGLTNGGTATVNFTVPCTPPPQGYQYRGTATDNGATVTIAFTLDMSTFDDPAVPNANEQIGVLDGSFTYPAARLQATSCTYGSVLGSPVAPNFSNPGTVIFSGVNTNASAGFTQFTVLTCTFNDLGGATPISTSTNLTLAFDSGASFDFLPNILITEASAP